MHRRNLQLSNRAHQAWRAVAALFDGKHKFGGCGCGIAAQCIGTVQAWPPPCNRNDATDATGNGGHDTRVALLRSAVRPLFDVHFYVA